MAGLLDKLDERETWERFYAYKTALVCPGDAALRLREEVNKLCGYTLIE